jgi:ataxia telangiectasia mutated family protein
MKRLVPLFTLISGKSCVTPHMAVSQLFLTLCLFSRSIVFEQGKLLTTPEKVPFRLTRNLIDGMGPSGVEGTFIASAEETTRVLRNNADALLTILSAVVDDPLYKWSLSPVEARTRQKDDEANEEKVVTDGGVSGLTTDLGSSEDQNKAAAKAVAKIKAKLQGYEDSTSGEQHGVLGQVLLLVNSARDPDNLCQMFPGWSPWI